MITRLVPAALLLALLIANPASAEWGALKGKFILDGSAPTPKKLNINKDVDYCTKYDPTDDSLVVGQDNSLQGVVLFVRLGRGDSIEAHPSYEKLLEDTVILDNKGCMFHDHVSLVRVGQPFTIKNSDTVGHNTNASLQKNGSFNIIIPGGEEREMTFQKAERLPLPIACNIHPWMSAHLLVLDHPYMAVSGEDGSFEIANLPAGEHEFQFWQGRIGYLKNCKYGGGSLDKRGRADITIADGETLDLGEVKVPLSLVK